MGLKPCRQREIPGRRAARAAVRTLYLGWLSCCLVFLAAKSACASSPPPAAPAAVNKGRHAASANASPNSVPESAVVFDDAYRLPAKDLLLNLDGERKAEANARFMHGLVSEDAINANGPNSEFLKSLALDPANVELSVAVAQDYLRTGDVPAAINLLKDTIKAAPKQAEPLLALAYIYFTSQNKPDLALKAATQALELDPNNILAYIYLRILYNATQQSAKTVPLLERAAKADSKNPEFWLQLGKLYIQTFIGEDSPKGEDNLKKTSAIFQKAAAVGSDSAETVNKVANFYALTKQFKEAVPLFERVVDIDPSQLAARENLARCFLATEQPAKAALVLEELIKLNPADPHAYALLGKIYEDAGDITRATQDYEQSLLVNPNDSQGYETIVLMLLDHKQPERAIPVLNEARRRFPNEPGFSYYLAVALEQTKQHQQALSMFEQTEAEAQSVRPSLLSGRFYFQYGATAEQAGLFDRAAQLMKKSLGMEEDPRLLANTSNYLGYMWVDHSINVEEGGELIKRAVEAEPDNGAYLDSLGWYYYRTNQFEQATAQLTKAVQKTEPEDPTVYEHLGDAYSKRNDTAKAVECWQKAIELDPKNTEVPELTKKIAAAKGPMSPAPVPTPKG